MNCARKESKKETLNKIKQTNKKTPQNVIKCYATYRNTNYGIDDHSCLLLDFQHSAKTKIDMKNKVASYTAITLNGFRNP